METSLFHAVSLTTTIPPTLISACAKALAGLRVDQLVRTLAAVGDDESYPDAVRPLRHQLSTDRANIEAIVGCALTLEWPEEVRHQVRDCLNQPDAVLAAERIHEIIRERIQFDLRLRQVIDSQFDSMNLQPPQSQTPNSEPGFLGLIAFEVGRSLNVSRAGRHERIVLIGQVERFLFREFLNGRDRGVTTRQLRDRYPEGASDLTESIRSSIRTLNEKLKVLGLRISRPKAGRRHLIEVSQANSES